MTFIQKLKNPLITGTLFLTASGVISRIIGFFYRIFLSRTIGAEGLGIYQLVFPVMALSLSLTSSGIQTALSRFIAEETAKNNEKGARLYLVLGLLFSTALSVAVSFLITQNADFIASVILSEPRTKPLLIVMTYSLLPAAVHACINGYYYGKKQALIPSVSQLLEQLVRVGTVYLIASIAMENGHSLSPLDAIWGIVAGECAGMLLSVTAVGIRRYDGDAAASAKLLFAMTIPLTANRVLINLCTSVENLMIPKQLRLFGYNTPDALSIFGILTGMSMSVILFPTVLTGSVSVLLLPAISEAKARSDDAAISHAIQKAVRYGLLLGFFFTGAFLITADFIGDSVFHCTLAGTYIKILSWLCPFMYLSSLLSSIIHGLGYPKIPLYISLLGCMIRIGAIWRFVPVFGLRAYLTGMLISQLVMAVLSLFSLKKVS